MMKRLMVAFSMFAMMGCSGSMSGSVGGVSLNVADAIFAVIKGDDGKAEYALIAMSDKPKMCDSLKANREPKSSTSVLFQVYRLNSMLELLAPDVGDYTTQDTIQASAGSHATAYFQRTDSNCTQTVAGSASTGKSGLIKLTAIKGETNGTASGTYDITFGAGDKVTGNFNASYCDISKLPTGSANCE